MIISEFIDPSIPGVSITIVVVATALFIPAVDPKNRWNRRRNGAASATWRQRPSLPFAVVGAAAGLALLIWDVSNGRLLQMLLPIGCVILCGCIIAGDILRKRRGQAPKNAAFAFIPPLLICTTLLVDQDFHWALAVWSLTALGLASLDLFLGGSSPGGPHSG